MTDLESPKKNNDCYFYYYSTCSKGDNCGFRHEPSALGCETVCSFWKEGKCLNVHCNFRHMELRKNRKAIQCYWETQPGGCLKPHCPFMHKAAREVPPSEKPIQPDNMFPEKCNETDTFKPSPSVDSLVVNFEEESDNESTSPSPEKFNISMHEKTQEELRLEKIQEACAAYYSYPMENEPMPSQDDLRQRIWNRLQHNPSFHSSMETDFEQELEQISWKRKQQFSSADVRFVKRQKVAKEINLEDIKIKTLAEIRAEKAAKFEQLKSTEAFKPTSLETREQTNDLGSTNKVNYAPVKVNESAEDEVSSTCPEDEPPPMIQPETKPKPVRKLNLKKIKSVAEDMVTSNQSSKDDFEQNAQEDVNKQRLDKEETMLGNIDSNKSAVSLTESLLLADNEGDEIKTLKGDVTKRVLEVSKKIDSDKSAVSLDETLLLADNDGDLNVTLKTEDDLLNEIDDLLND